MQKKSNAFSDYLQLELNTSMRIHAEACIQISAIIPAKEKRLWKKIKKNHSKRIVLLHALAATYNYKLQD